MKKKIAKKYDIEKELAKMTKKLIWKEVGPAEEYLEGTIQHAIDVLTAYNSDEYRLETDGRYDEWDFYLQKSEPESDRDFERRKEKYKHQMERENLAIDRQLENDKKEYERLKKQFEGK